MNSNKSMYGQKDKCKIENLMSECICWHLDVQRHHWENKIVPWTILNIVLKSR